MAKIGLRVKYKMVSELDFHEYPISGTIQSKIQIVAIPGDFDLLESYNVTLSFYWKGTIEPSIQPPSVIVPLGGKTYFFLYISNSLICTLKYYGYSVTGSI